MDLAALAIAVPLLAAAGLVGLRPLLPRWGAQVLGVAAAAAVAVLCSIVLVRARDETLVYWLGGWRPRGGVAIGIGFEIDQFGAGAAVLAALLAVGAVVFSLRYVGETDDLFEALMLVFLAGMVGFSFSGDLFTLFVFFELTLISAFVLCGYQIERRAPLEGSLNFAVVNSVGGFLFLFGIGLVYGRTGALNLAQIGRVLDGEPADALVAVAFGLIVCALLIKAAIVPFHFWLADAYAVARTPVCILLAGVMSELGLYAVGRIYWSAFSGAFTGAEGELRAILVAAGVVTAVLGALMALAQTHLKRLLAFVTVSYLGLMLAGVGLLTAEGLAGAALFAVGDGFLKAALFVGVGVVQHRFGHVDVGPLHGRGRALTVTAVLFAVSSFAVASLPPFGSFLGKTLLEHGATSAGYGWLVPVFVGVSALCGAALLRAWARVFAGLGEPAEEPRTIESSGEEAGREGDEPPGRRPWTMLLPLAAFIVAGLAAGVWPGLADGTVAAAERFVDHRSYAVSALGGSAGPPRAAIPSGVPHWYDWLYSAISLGGAVLVAWVTLQGRRPARPLRRPLSVLRAAHSGHPGDYVAFVVAGTAILGGLFTLLLT